MSIIDYWLADILPAVKAVEARVAAGDAAASEEEFLLLNPALRLLVKGGIPVVNRGEMLPAAFRAFLHGCHLP